MAAVEQAAAGNIPRILSFSSVVAAGFSLRCRHGLARAYRGQEL